MTKQFLLHLNVCAVLIQKSRIRAPKRVPATPLNSDLAARAEEPPTLCLLRVYRIFVVIVALIAVFGVLRWLSK